MKKKMNSDFTGKSGSFEKGFILPHIQIARITNNMKKLFYFLIIGIFSSCSTTINNDDEIFLKWKLDSDEILSYKTVMEKIDESKFEIDFTSLFDSLKEDNSEAIEKTKDFFNDINEAFHNTKLTTILSKGKDGIIEIKMIAKTQDNNTSSSIASEMLRKLQLQNDGVMLRGSVTENGEIHSFWLKSAQKNLIALWFELPNKSIKIGDAWSLSINFITNDQNFICEESYKKNIVKLLECKQVNNETIAVLKYDIEEYVSGSINMPSTTGDRELKDIMMKFNYQGIAEFLIEKGRWLSYDGILSFEAEGMMNIDTKQKFSLITE